MRYITIAFVLLTTVLLVSCKEKPTDSGPDIRDHGFHLAKCDFEELYWNKPTLYNSIHPSLCDENGVALFEWAGQYYYHPVYIGHLCLKALSDYNNTGDAAYLNYVTASSNALLQQATRSNGGIYFPYMFDYEPFDPSLVYTAPWYSGMAQGVLLSTFSRLYYLTGNSKYRAYADSVLVTMFDYDNPISTVYVTENDSLCFGDGYFWVDEYPNPIRRFVLNGSISGSFGLYDHWWVFGDQRSKIQFSREMTSIKDHVLLYRDPGDISFYDLLFKEKVASYHNLHQTLLNKCYLYTGDDYFQIVDQLLYNDFH